MQKMSQSSLSVWIVSGITILALLLGWALKSSVESRSSSIESAGVKAQAPAGWVVTNGLVSQQMVFTTRDPFSSNLSYTASLVPSTADMKPSDLAFTFNLQRAKDASLFRVLDQGAVKVNGKDAYRVHYTYVDPKDQGALPVVVEGVEYIYSMQPKALVVALEEESSQFENALPSFMRFLGTVVYTPGGN
jgi:hypothetical protein